MKDSIELSCKFPVSCERLFSSWLNSEQHSAFTGGLAAIEGKPNSRFTAWDGYITGTILELDENQRILQSWRTTEFPDDAEDSMVELTFSESDSGCVLHLKHWNIPEGQGKKYMTGWFEHYCQPMEAYFKSELN